MTQTMKVAKPEIQAQEGHEARIIFGPLERGYGHTLGNALRRILLSSIPGAAVVEVRIEGVQHECDTIEGVREDVIELLLNLKQLAVQVHGGEESDADRYLTLVKKGKGPVTASDFELPADIKIANPKLHLCTLTNGSAELSMQVAIRMGRGYEPADQRVSEEEKPIGTLEIDATFSPVRKVSYQVESVRVAGQTDLDRLLLNLTTNGTVEPETLIGDAAVILCRQLQPLTELTERSEAPEAMPTIYTEPLSVLNLETRIINVLRDNLNMHRVGDLVNCTEYELLQTPRLSTKSVDQIKEILLQNQLMLNMELPNWPPEKSGS